MPSNRLGKDFLLSLHLILICFEEFIGYACPRQHYSKLSMMLLTLSRIFT